MKKKLKIVSAIAFIVIVCVFTPARDMPFLFFFHPKDVDDAHYHFLVEGFEHPVCIDTKDELNRLNSFPPDDVFHTFLLDKNNKIAVSSFGC